MAPEAPSPAATAPLAGLTVLDSTLALAGRFATFLLAGLGARVIKIEHPQAPDPCRENPPVGQRHVMAAAIEQRHADFGSNWRTCWLSDGWDVRRRSAARVKFNSSATATK